MAIDKDVLLLTGMGHPVYVLRRGKEGWEREATFTYRDGEVVLARPNEYGSTIADCKSIAKNLQGYDFSFFSSAGAVQDNAVFFVKRGIQSDGKGTGTIYTSVYDGDRWSKPIALPPLPNKNADDIGSTLTVDENVLVNGDRGVVYVYERASVTQPWLFKESILSPRANGGYDFGHPVAVSGDTLVVGASSMGEGVSLFVRNAADGKWKFDTYLYPEDVPQTLPSGSRFGKSVDIQNDLIVVGASGMNFPDGVAFVYKRSRRTGKWKQVDKIKHIGGRPFWDLGRYFVTYGFGSEVNLSGNSIMISTGGGHNAERGLEGGEVFTHARIPFTNKW